MKMRFIIVDDEPLAQRVIEKYAVDIPTLELVGKGDSAYAAMELLSRVKVDLMFLDINMPKLLGIDFLKMLHNRPLVVLTTAYREYALDGYELDVVDYLTKPFSFERFYKSIQKAQELFSLRNGHSIEGFTVKEKNEDDTVFFVKADSKIFKVDLNQLLFIEALGDYVKIHTVNSTVVTYQSLKGIEEQLPVDKFPRVHKSFIVAFNKIDLIEGNTIKIGKFEIPIGKNYRKGFFGQINLSSRKIY